MLMSPFANTCDPISMRLTSCPSRPRFYRVSPETWLHGFRLGEEGMEEDDEKSIRMLPLFLVRSYLFVEAWIDLVQQFEKINLARIEQLQRQLFEQGEIKRGRQLLYSWKDF